MSYRQAFHTSCRKGLSAHAGFQYNAASEGLDEEQLTRLAAEHAGYQTPPDSPAEPSAEEIARMPVDLRYRPVEGIGPVISRTVYVGREFRGRGGEPDSGRFGNYFSHIVVGEDRGDGEGAFGGLLPIELWQAPHWTSDEADDVHLSPLAALAPGPLDLDRVLAELSGRAAILAAVADAALRAVLGGPRLVIVEADAALAAAWVAWASYVLPADRARELIFSTFAGRPRMAEALQVCVTTPACDVEFAPHELGNAAVVIDTGSGSPAAELSLYGRVLAELVPAGAEAIAAVIRQLPAGLDLDAAGAELAVSAQRTELAVGAESAAIVAALRRRIDGVPAAALAEAAAVLPEDPSALDEWALLFAAARQSHDPGATALVDAALDRLLGSLESGGDLGQVAAGATAVPSAGVLVKWLGLLAEAEGSERFARLLSAGVRLGLVGCNTALDKELGGLIAAGFADPMTQRVYETLAGDGNALVVEAVALELAASAGAGDGIELLERAAAEPIAREAIRRNAEEAASFESVAAWQLLRVSAEPSRRSAAAALLAERATEAGHERTIRSLYGEAGPTSASDHAELLTAWRRSGQDAPLQDYERALACLAAVPLTEARATQGLFEALCDGPAAVRGEPDLGVWRLAFNPAPERQDFHAWTKAAVLLRRGKAISASRRDELGALAARIAVGSEAEPDFERGIALLLDQMDDEWPLELGDALARAIDKSIDPQQVVGRAFATWYRLKRWRGVLLEVSLPRATGDRSAKELEAVGELLTESGRQLWEDWLEQHPPRRAVSRAVRGVFRRGGER